jgi:hypothetical protein
MDMKFIRVTVLCLVAIFATGVVAATASAATVEEKTGKGEGTTTNEKGEPIKIKWEKDEIKGTSNATGLKSSGNTLFSTSLGGVKCKSPGAKEGEVKTAPLTATLGFINKAKNEVGLEVKPSEGEVFAKFTCGEVTVEIKGAVIGSIGPVNKLVELGSHFTTEFAQKEGKQAIKKFEGGAEVGLSIRLSGGSFRAAAFQDSGELFFSEVAEIVTSPSLEFT